MSVPLRVLSYNIHSLRDDRASLTGLVRDAAPDVVIVQEAPRRFRWRHKCAALADDFGMVVAAGGLPSLGNLLLVSLRVRVLDTWCLRYPLTPGRHMRGAAFLRGSVRGATFTVTGSHLATDPAERPTQAARWKEAIATVDGPVIAGGDLPGHAAPAAPGRGVRQPGRHDREVRSDRHRSGPAGERPSSGADGAPAAFLVTRASARIARCTTPRTSRTATRRSA